ncbi:MFS transporter [Paraburkholderia caballeronis]|uniref:MFS transporter n=1 Tax=Paraburkholderia caballeronis TaxID=416943 RepID=UPI001064D9D4|nr:MFS transporter [Paraburkholderia caballeronis]TDV13944.1 DHA1 family multidrug resistance protein-like MFS transporter [Paraburkholderia caballeronis]TDV15457.1 DHA1 family multidrug resistance protein-like MFS transporter [Paraburkholderia caballeronis]TDV24925.1 DHA1 family multidrug resistance protein-like MFS transporter [Paraburkholderia caballeronis]
MVLPASSPASPLSGTSPPPGYAERNRPHWRRNLAVCVFGSFTTLVSLSMLLPFLPLYVEQLGVTSPAAVVQWSGVAFGATFFGTAITAPLWGRLADRYGRKPMLVRAALGMAVVMSLIGVARSVTDLVALRLVAGLIGGYASASIVMIGTQAPRERAGWALGVLSTGALAGNLVGPLVGGFLPGWVGLRGTFFVGGAMIAVAAAATILLVREDFDRLRDTQARAASAGAREPGAGRAVIVALLATAMMVLLANMSIEPIITVYIGQLGVPRAHLARVAGFVMACSAFGSMLTAPRLGALADRIGSWNVIVGCLVATALVMVPQAFVTSWWQLAALRGLMGMTIAGLLPSIAKLVRQSVDENRSGKTLGYLQSAQFSGQVVGPLIGAQIGAHVGLHQVFFVTGALLVVCAAVNHRVRARSAAAQRVRA